MSDNTFQLFDLEPDLLATFLHDRKLWVDYSSHIDAKYFKKDEIGFIYKFFKLYFDKYRDLPDLNQTLSVMRKKNKEQIYIDTAESIYTAKPFEKHKVDALREEIKLFIKKEKLFDALEKNMEILDKSRHEVEDDEFYEFSEAVKQATLWKDEVDLGVKLHEVEERYEKIAEEDTHKVPSPWPNYNDTLDGGYRAKQLTLFIANSSAGKSIALDQSALEAWKQGLNVVLYTMELSDLVKSQRIDACLTGIKMKSLALKKDDVAKAYQNINSGGILYIKEYPMYDASVADFEQHLYQLELYEGVKEIGMIVADYIDIMKVKGKSTGDLYKEHGIIAGNLRALATIYNCPVLSATQFSRAGINAESIDDINESIMGDSIIKLRNTDVLTAIFGTPEETMNNEIWFKNLKNRGGQKDQVLAMSVDYPHLRFGER